MKMNALIEKAAELGLKDADEARALIRQHKIQSVSKLTSFIQNRPSGIRVDQDTAEAVTKRIKTVKKSVHRAGPRGFRYGAVFLKSVAEGKGVAVRPANLPKLLSLAKATGVQVPNRKDTTPRDIAEAIKPAL